MDNVDAKNVSTNATNKSFFMGNGISSEDVVTSAKRLAAALPG
jgi:hypothetical protein